VPDIFPKPPQVGELLDGYCGGAFMLGNDYVRIEAVGWDWLVVRGPDAHAAPQFFEADGPEGIDALLSMYRVTTT